MAGDINIARCKPSLDAREVERVAASAWRSIQTGKAKATGLGAATMSQRMQDWLVAVKNTRRARHTVETNVMPVYQAIGGMGPSSRFFLDKEFIKRVATKTGNDGAQCVKDLLRDSGLIEPVPLRLLGFEKRYSFTPGKKGNGRCELFRFTALAKADMAGDAIKVDKLIKIQMRELIFGGTLAQKRKKEKSRPPKQKTKEQQLRELYAVRLSPN